MKKLLLVLIVAFAAFSCKKDSFTAGKNAIVLFSADTVFFDTVFTSTGSVTEAVKIYNDNNQKISLSGIRLMGGASSSYSININGIAGPERDNIEVDAGDSIYVFVAVKIDPSAANLPFVIQDSIQISYNGNQRFIQLQAYGQNAHFLRNQVITGNTVWGNSLPYVILGGLQVDTNASLTIPAGCKVYFHADAPLLVDGSLLVNGDHYDSTRVYFQGDRLDEPYKNYPDDWPGIIFRGASAGSLLRYAVIRNAYQAVVVESPPAPGTPKVILEQCIINNSSDAGILGVQGSLQAINCLISNCGKNIELQGGGSYQFTHCTDAAYSNIYVTHTNPALALSDQYVSESTTLSGDLQASFVNCIFWGANGTVTDEVQATHQTNNAFNVSFQNCLWKVGTTPSNVSVSSMIAGLDPLFDSVSYSNNYYDFHLKPGSPAVDAGIATSVIVDLDGNPRPLGLPDLGCYENQ